MDISDMLEAEESLFRNQEVFDPDYTPEQFEFRDSQMKELTFCLKPALRKGRPSSAFIVGQPATGKTTSVKLVFQHLRDEYAGIVPVYINCHIQSSAYKIFSEIRKAVLRMPPPDSGVPLAKVQDEVFGELAEKGKALVVCLDEINYLLANGTADEILYTLLRAHEVYAGSKTAVFAISTEDVIHAFSDKVRSIFSPVRIEFRPYSGQETIEILRFRRDVGLCSNVLSNALLETIASKTKDLRFGIELMKQSALAAESDASKKILPRHVEKAEKSIQPPEASRDKMVVLSLVRERKEIESGELFEKVAPQLEISYPTFYRMLKKLEAGGFLEIESVAAKDGVGRSSRIRAK